MNVNKHHSEWLSLLDIQGVFLSFEVLNTHFPQGLETLDRGLTTQVREVYTEWCQDNHSQGIHREWILWVLTQILLYPDRLLLTKTEIPPRYQHRDCEIDYILIHPTDSSPLLFIKTLPPEQKLEAIPKLAPFSPTTALRQHLKRHNLRIGLLTNGEQWMLINAPINTTSGYISWYSQLWLDESITLRSFIALLNIRRFLQVEVTETLPNLLEESIHSQQEVTDYLGYQVKKAIEIFIQRLEIISQDEDKTYLHNLSPEDVYQGVTSVMLRLIFLLSAEAKQLLPLDNPIYNQNYSITDLGTRLRDIADLNTEKFLSQRCDAWGRIIANFRAVYAGISHPSLELTDYQGNLFNPDRYPWLDGRKKGTCWDRDESEVINIDNLTILHILEGITILRVAKPGGGYEPRKISFKTLDVEQIGHVYESLLDHKVERATSTILKLIGNKDSSCLVYLEDLEKKRIEGEEELVSYLSGVTKRSKNAIIKNLYPEDITKLESLSQLSIDRRLVLQRFLGVCRNNLELWKRIKPFSGLIQWDVFEYPLIIPSGYLHLTSGEMRKETGSHYTPGSLTREIVRETINPLVYKGCKEGKPETEWILISEKELLELKVCDIACGSGAFLVQSCRYLGELLVKIWEKQNKIFIVSEEIKEKYLTQAKRIIVERCIYGVDINPVAVDMAKLSLWLETLQKNKPFTFIDHAIKVGDSLLGVSVNQLLSWDLYVSNPKRVIVGERVKRLLNEVIELRLKIENDHNLTTDEKSHLLFQSNSRIHDLIFRGDLLLSSYLIEGKSGSELNKLRKYLLMVSQSGKDICLDDVLDNLTVSSYTRLSSQVSEGGENDSFAVTFYKTNCDSEQERLDGDINSVNSKLRIPFHWELEFPEVFLTDKKGFDVIVSNPPFLGGGKISGMWGDGYRKFLQKWIANGKKGGQCDLVAYFFLRVVSLINDKGYCGLVATNTICQGDTREVGLAQIESQGIRIYRGVSSAKWEGTTSLQVSHVWMTKDGDYQGGFYLNGEKVRGITSYLTIPGRVTGSPYRLVANQNKSYPGSSILGMGFVLTPDEAKSLIERDQRNKLVLFPYLNGEDLNTHPCQLPSRWVINFQDWLLSPDIDDKSIGGPYASDFPDCLEIVERLVKPERDKLGLKNNSAAKNYAKNWWVYAGKRLNLYQTIKPLKRTLIRSRVSNTNAITFVPTDIIFSSATVIFPFDDYGNFAILQSIIHTEWVVKNTSTLGNTVSYNVSDCLETFPFPENAFLPPIANIGERYYTHRQQIMSSHEEGLTKTYNRFHSQTEIRDSIKQLRELQIEMDNSVLNAYNWGDIDLNYGWYETKQGLRYTICNEARIEILDRLLELNHLRYSQEVANGLHNPKSKSKKSKNV